MVRNKWRMAAFREFPSASTSAAAMRARTLLLYKQTHPTGPYFNSEFWAGWFDHWGGKHASTNLKTEAADLKWMLDQGFSVSIYMFHGGTSFGWMNGANTNGTNYEPDVTSYDYDAPLDESGRVTDKFRLFREIIASVPASLLLRCRTSYRLSRCRSSRSRRLPRSGSLSRSRNIPRK